MTIQSKQKTTKKAPLKKNPTVTKKVASKQSQKNPIPKPLPLKNLNPWQKFLLWLKK